MAKPPPSGPHSDISGVNRDARVNTPNRDTGKGGAAEKDAADKQSVGHPNQGKRTSSRENIKLKYIATKEHIADIFTKSLPKETFEYLKE